MIRPADTMSLVAQRVVLCVLAVVLLVEAGCVSRRTYDGVKAETLEQMQTFEAVRADVRELDQEIAGLQAANRREDATVSGLRAAIQREEAQLPIMNRQAEDTFASLKTQVATLMNQSWHLARKIVDIRQESASLKTKLAQYKEEMEQAELPTATTSSANSSAITQTAVIEPPPSTEATSSNAAPPQMAQTPPPPASPVPVKPAAPAPSVKADPPSTDDSWIGIITGWFTKIWNWLFG